MNLALKCTQSDDLNSSIWGEKKKSTDVHKHRRELLQVSTDQAVVGSERWIVKAPVVQVIVSGV